jgi:hypothetical protein
MKFTNLAEAIAFMRWLMWQGIDARIIPHRGK